MDYFTLEKTQTFGNVKVRLFSLKNKYHKNKLTAYIKERIAMTTQSCIDTIEKYASDIIDHDELKRKIASITMPGEHSIPAFDVKRSTVTEFMAEFLLEENFQCIFFEQTNKKIDHLAFETDHHISGVDLVGIQEQEELKLILAEVKASEEQKIPCKSASTLKKDMEKALDFENNRVDREILSMIQCLELKNEQIYEKYLNFLSDLIAKPDALKVLVRRIIIFPFLIRNYSRILEDSSLDDFKDFSELDTKDVEVTGILWAINKDINTFVDDIYASD